MEENGSLDDYNINDFDELELVQCGQFNVYNVTILGKAVHGFSICLFTDSNVHALIDMVKIHIHIIHSKRIHDYEMKNTDTVGDVKKKLQKDMGVKATKLVLVSGGVELKDKCLLVHCSAHYENATLKLVLPMESMYICTTFWLVKNT